MKIVLPGTLKWYDINISATLFLSICTDHRMPNKQTNEQTNEQTNKQTNKCGQKCCRQNFTNQTCDPPIPRAMCSSHYVDFALIRFLSCLMTQLVHAKRSQRLCDHAVANAKQSVWHCMPQSDLCITCKTRFVLLSTLSDKLGVWWYCFNFLLSLPLLQEASLASIWPSFGMPVAALRPLWLPVERLGLSRHPAVRSSYLFGFLFICICALA